MSLFEDIRLDGDVENRTLPIQRDNLRMIGA